MFYNMAGDSGVTDECDSPKRTLHSLPAFTKEYHLFVLRNAIFSEIT